jgi:hypothetical protein
MNAPFSFLRLFGLFSIGTILTLSSCKKSSGGGVGGSTNTSGYYLSATVNGKAWNANVANDSLKSPVLAGIDYTGVSYVLIVLGEQTAGKDTSAIALVFPENITLNKTVAFNAAQSIEAVYAASATAGYNTVSPGGTTDDSLTVTTFDQTSKVIEGTFKGTFYRTTGSGTVKITDGKFRTPYLMDINSLPPSNVKF